jgi:hypothetical protein
MSWVSRRSLIVSAMSVALAIASLAGLTLLADIGAGVARTPPLPMQSVDRSHKGDRLPLGSFAVKRRAPGPIVLDGCDPVFSPLARSAEANFPGRCLA